MPSNIPQDVSTKMPADAALPLTTQLHAAMETWLPALKNALYKSPEQAYKAWPWGRFGDHAVAGMSASAEFIAAAVPAAVLVLIVMREDGPAIILTERAKHLRKHAGQISFPGGRIDAGEDIRTAALREAEEEIGISAQKLEVLGYLPPYLSGSAFHVHPVVAVLSDDAEFTANADEVARIFTVPFSFLLEPSNYRLESLTWLGAERQFYALYHQEARIWGITAGIIRLFFETIQPKEAPDVAHHP